MTLSNTKYMNSYNTSKYNSFAGNTEINHVYPTHSYERLLHTCAT